MAFISGYKSRYECKACNEEVSFDLVKTLKTKKQIYKHGNELIFANGYPCPCKFNGKELTEEQVNKINSPVIQGNKNKY